MKKLIKSWTTMVLLTAALILGPAALAALAETPKMGGKLRCVIDVRSHTNAHVLPGSAEPERQNRLCRTTRQADGQLHGGCNGAFEREIEV